MVRLKHISSPHLPLQLVYRKFPGTFDVQTYTQLNLIIKNSILDKQNTLRDWRQPSSEDYHENGLTAGIDGIKDLSSAAEDLESEPVVHLLRGFLI